MVPANCPFYLIMFICVALVSRNWLNKALRVIGFTAEKSTIAKSCASSTLSVHTLFFQKWNSVFQIQFLECTGYTARVFVICFALLQSIPTYFGAHLASCSMSTGACFPRSKAAKAWSCALASTCVQAWKWAELYLQRVISLCVLHKDSLYLPFC